MPDYSLYDIDEETLEKVLSSEGSCGKELLLHSCADDGIEVILDAYNFWSLEIVLKSDNEVVSEYECDSISEAIDVLNEIANEEIDNLRKENMDRRETEISSCFEDFLYGIYGEKIWGNTREELIEEAKEDIINILAEKIDSENMVRPMFLINEDTGEEFFTNHPYKYL